MHLRLSNAPFHCHSFFHRINLHVPLSQCKSTPVDPRIPRPVITVHVNIFNLIKLSFLSCPMHLFIYLNEFGLDWCTQKGVVEHAYECSHVCHFLLPLISWQSRKVPVFTTAGQSPERARSAQGNYRQEVQGTQKGVVEHASVGPLLW